MYRTQSSDNRIFLDSYVSCQRCGIGQDDVICNDAVMGDVAICHDETVAADAGDSAPRRRPTVNRHALADRVVVTDLEPRSFTFELQVLWLKSQSGEWKHPIIRAHFRWAFEDDMGEQFAVLSHINIFTDNAKGANHAPFWKVRFRIYESCGMNACAHAGRLTS